MGNCNFKNEAIPQMDSTSCKYFTLLIILKSAVSKNLFQLHYIIGKGGFGKVYYLN